MSFLFNFSHSVGEYDEIEVTNTVTVHDSMDVEALHPLQFIPSPDPAQGSAFCSLEIAGITIRRVLDVNEETNMNANDLIPGVYGGGKVVWECSLDLAAYLLEKHSDLLHTGDSILELGCGHGIPGIAMLLRGHRDVWFSDLNAEVIQATTWTNIQANCTQPEHVTCVSGDWNSLSNHLTAIGKGFHLIISAETLYSPQTCLEVALFLEAHLLPDGCALLATKRFYFGVGGGSYELDQIISSRSLPLLARTVRSYENGQSNIRDIILVTRSDAL